MDQIKALQYKNKYSNQQGLKQQPSFKKLGKKILYEKSLRLEQSKILDNADSDDDNIFKQSTILRKKNMNTTFNDLRKKVIKGDTDKNSIFVDLMQTMSPRTIGLKL